MNDKIKVFYVALWRLSYEMPKAIDDYVDEVYANKLDDEVILVNGKRRKITSDGSACLPYPPEAYCTSYSTALDVLRRKVRSLNEHVHTDEIFRLEPQLERAYDDATRYAKFEDLINKKLAASEGQ